VGNFDLNLLFNTFQTRRDDTTGRGQKAVRMRICTYDHINAHEGGGMGCRREGYGVQRMDGPTCTDTSDSPEYSTGYFV